MKVSTIALGLALVGFAHPLMAQSQGEQECLNLDPKEWRLPPEGEARTEVSSYNARYSDLFKAGELNQECLSSLRWLWEHHPDLNPSIYINGAKIYETLGDEEQDPARKIELYDTAIWCYDQRIHYYCDEDGELLDRKAFRYFKFFYKVPERFENIHNLFTEAYQKRGNALSSINVEFYMQFSAFLAKNKRLDEDKFLDVYENMSEVVAYKAENGELTEEAGTQLQNKLDGLLVDVVEINDAFIEKRFCPSFQEDPTNVERAKKIIFYSISGKATNHSCYLPAAKLAYKADPTAAMARLIADKLNRSGDDMAALDWYQKAIDLMEDNVKKSEIYYLMATIHSGKGRLSSARSMALMGIEEDPTNNKHYILIGDLYVGSFNQCKGGANIVHDRAVYIAAYNWYRKAGATERMASAKAQFPSTQDIFSYDMEEGQSYTVGCWIGETVTITARD